MVRDAFNRCIEDYYVIRFGSGKMTLPFVELGRGGKVAMTRS